MPPRRKPCEFHLNRRGGCRNGAQCNFLHVGPAGSGIANTPTAQATTSIGSPNLSTQAASGAPSASNERPRDACPNFWASGACERMFDCRFKHLKPNEARTTQPTQAGAPANAFLQDDALGRISSASDIFSLSTQSLTPTEAHNYIKLFLRPDYTFKTARNMHSFATILSSANSESPAWQLSDGQAFLALIAKPGGNGVLRIGEIFRHENVSVRAGNDPGLLSFQRGYVPVLNYLSSQFVIKSTMHHDVNSLYAIVDTNIERIAEVLTQCMMECVAVRTFSEQSPGFLVTGTHLFRVMATFLTEYVGRFKNVISRHPQMHQLVLNLQSWFKTWEDGVNSQEGSWVDPIKDAPAGARSFLISRLRHSVETLASIVERAEGATSRRTTRMTSNRDRNLREEGLLSALELTYVGPGDERPDGRRHDNDHSSIANIKIAPTQDELVCEEAPYLPANLPGAPHHLPNNSMDRLFDIQFRLLREELIAPIKTSVNMLIQDIRSPHGVKTQLDDILKKRGGLYKGDRSSIDSVTFSVYTTVYFHGLDCSPRHGLSVEMSFDAPSGRAQHEDSSVRQAYWESVGKRRLMQGGLVALIWCPATNPTDIQVHLGAITSNLESLMMSAKRSNERLHLKVSFFDPSVEFRILQMLQNKTSALGDSRYLVEAPIMFESIRPFLETLQRVEPSHVPFTRTLVHPESGSLSNTPVQPPEYAARPEYIMDLSSLFDKDRNVTLHLRPENQDSVADARKALKDRSRLDPSQADAVVDCLTREISLIQGPPGTGKSYTGVELIRVLLANKVRPIILIAFTNHALDHLLSKVLEAGITRKIVRLGSRSNDERISEFSMENILSIKVKERAQADRTARFAYRSLKETAEKMKALMKRILSRQVEPMQMEKYLAIHYPNHFEEIHPPAWIFDIFEEEKEWSKGSQSLLEFWYEAKDLAFIDPPTLPSPKHREQGKEVVRQHNRFGALAAERTGEETDGTSESEDDTRPTVLEPQNEIARWFELRRYPGIPPIPNSNRPLQELLQSPEIWKMSLSERRTLCDAWIDEVRVAEYEKQVTEFSRLQEMHSESREQWVNAENQTRLQVLRSADLIGCTTNGAAKLTSLLTNLEPKVLLVEEAGQVLEAHILASLVPSIQSLVLIGDPQQLRPTLANYHLSMDNPRTGKIYRFDQSLMERLSTMGYHMSQLEVQRRMRPTISSLIRSTLYPGLKDHDIVKNYPPVRGFAKNVFFFSHQHAEQGGGDESVSKNNPFEARMVKDLVMHLLRQGIYSDQGSIVVLCAYLGQLMTIRKELSKEVTTVIDERDEALIIDHEESQEMKDAFPKTVTAEEVTVTKRVVLRTVDNFQGEEGDVVILSLVRNSGNKIGERPSGIGFLKSVNRTNVALSRAKHGLFILGNADDLVAQSPLMWRGVIEELRQQGHIGPGIPICCHQHQGNVIMVDRPGMISQYAPDGGCLIPCGAQLACGHQCPWKCHSDDPDHISVKCQKDCQRLCPRMHPCDKRCFQQCGLCPFLVEYIPPNCGHVNIVQCHQLDDPESIICSHRMRKKLPACEHSATMACGMDPALYICQSTCNIQLPCCRKSCASKCGKCQKLNTATLPDTLIIARTSHERHKCVKPLYCQHLCGGDCSEGHDCTKTICSQPCRQHCSHHACSKPCSEPCPPCVEAICEWRCDHQQCPVACGSVCARVPCDRQCETELKCGHRCPSVCGEDCAIQICPACAKPRDKAQVVDLIMGQTLGELRLDAEVKDLDELLITLSCGHIFTVETLDGTCHLNDYYTRENDVWTGLAQPPEGFQLPPLCPNCRSSITARRYGRVFKRANLDMLEQHIASSSRRRLTQVLDLYKGFEPVQTQAAIDQTIERYVLPNPTTTLIEINVPLNTARRKLLNPHAKSPLSIKLLGAEFKETFPLSKTLATSWEIVARPLLKVYSGACAVASVKSSNSRAYEAAFATLFRLHFDQLKDDDAWADVSPETHVHEKARIACGQAPPRADLRFQVEALWLTINVRFDLAKVAHLFLAKLKDKKEVHQEEGEKKVPEVILKAWSQFILFILDSAYNDCHIAIRLATESNSQRQIVKSTLLLLRATLERFIERSTQEVQSSQNQADRRQQLANQATLEASSAKLISYNTQKTYRIAMDGGAEQLEWLQKEFADPALLIIGQWGDLATKLKMTTFYQPVSPEELQAIGRAFGSGSGYSSGRWLTCPNGHLYVITECGGAVTQSRCPECGQSIGGSSYQLASGNQDASLMGAARR